MYQTVYHIACCCGEICLTFSKKIRCGRVNIQWNFNNFNAIIFYHYEYSKYIYYPIGARGHIREACGER